MVLDEEVPEILLPSLLAQEQGQNRRGKGGSDTGGLVAK